MMDETRYETLLDENTNLKRALSSTKHVLERTLNDYETLKQIHEDFKGQYDRLKRDSEDGNQKYIQLLTDKKEIESQFDNTIRNFKIAIEQKQKELEDVQAKLIPSLDHDMIRIKIINELEGPQRLALESKQFEIDKLQDHVYEIKRQFEILSSKHETVKYESEKELRDLKERQKNEVHELMLEIEALQERIEDTRDKDTVRILRRELDELKFRSDENENEMEDLRREKDRLREEKNDILIKLNRHIELEKGEKRGFKSENDRLSLKVRQLENDLSSIYTKIDDKQAEIDRLQKVEEENDKLRQDNDIRTKQISGLQAQVRDLEDSQVSSQTKLQEYISQAQLQTHEKHISEKSRIAALQREMESYQKTIVDLENKHRNNNFQVTKDLDSVKQEHTRLEDSHQQLQRTLENKEEEVTRLKRELENLHDEIYYIQKKNKELVIHQDGTSHATGFGQRGVNRDAELLSESLSREEKLKNKVIRLKAKLRAANKKIMELLPHKILAQKDSNSYINTISKNSEALAVSNTINPGDIIGSLKSKYGIIDSSNIEIPMPSSDVKIISAKYRAGTGGQLYGGRSTEFRHGFDNHTDKYQPKDENIIYNEIERTADKALRKLGINSAI